MSTEVKFRGGTTLEHVPFAGADREMTIDTTKKTVVVHDGSTQGGQALARDKSNGRTDLEIENHEKIIVDALGRIDGDLGVIGNVNATGNINIDGILTGDGSGLINITGFNEGDTVQRWIFKDAADQPLTPGASEDTPIALGWTNSAPSTYTHRLWISLGNKLSNEDNFTWGVPTPHTGEQGLTGVPGPAWHSGSGDPPQVLGIVGDFYLDVDDERVWEKISIPGSPDTWIVDIDHLGGTDGDLHNWIFQDSPTKPEVPDPSTGIPASWTDIVPVSPTTLLWATIGIKAGNIGDFIWGNVIQLSGDVGPTGHSIYPIYAIDENGTNAALIQGTRTYVNFYESPTIITQSDLTNGNIDVSSLIFVKIAGGNIYPIYATDEDGLNASLTPASSKMWVNFYESATPIYDLSGIDVTNLLFIQYIGTNGDEGLSTYTYTVYTKSSSILTSADTPYGGSFNFGTNLPTEPPPQSATVTWYNDISDPVLINSTDQLWSSRAIATVEGVTGVSTNTLVWSTPVKGAQDGTNGVSKYTWPVYLRSSTTPAKPVGGSFDFDSNIPSPPPGGWSNNIPSVGTDQIYQSYAIATITGATDTWDATGLNPNPWSTPVPFIRDGADGINGDAVAQLSVYTRSATPPVPLTPGNGAPAGTYVFSTNTLTAPTGWSTSIPNGTDPLYHSISNVSKNENNAFADTLTPVWSSGEIISGNDGTAGKSTFLYPVYIRSVGTPATPTGTNAQRGYYDFGENEGEPPSNPNQWSNNIPTGLDQLYVSTTMASAVGPTGIDDDLDWTTPTISGVDGLNAVSTFAYQVYYRAPSAPDQPTAGTESTANGEFNFTANEGIPPFVEGTSGTRWSNNIPTGTDPVWVTRTLASITGSEGSDSILEWTLPDKAYADGQNGTIGSDGDNGVTTVQLTSWFRGSTPPPTSTPTGGSYNFGTNGLTPPTGWSTTPPPDTGVASDILYQTVSSVWSQHYIDENDGTLKNYNTSATYDAVSEEWSIVPTWSTSVKSSGDFAKSTYTYVLYRRSATDLNFSHKPTDGTGSFNFTTNLPGTPPDGKDGVAWYNTEDADGTDDQLWSCRALASIDGHSGTDDDLDWSDPIKGQMDARSTYTYQVFRRSSVDINGNTSHSPKSGTGPGTGSFNFGTNLPGAAPDGVDGVAWSNITPPGTDDLYVSRAIASVLGATGEDSSLSWGAPEFISSSGTNGAPGYSATSVQVYKKGPGDGDPPTDLSGAGQATYYFASGNLTFGSPGNLGWTTEPPALLEGEESWVCTALASATETYDIISPSEWSDPLLYSKVGNDGETPLNNAVVFAYQKSDVTLTSKPGGPHTYTFATATSQPSWSSSNLGNSWVSDLGAVGTGTSLWMCSATASDAGPSDVVESSDWSNPIEVASDGTNGIGLDGKITVSGWVYLTAGQSSSSTPTAPWGYSYNISAGTFGSLKPGWSTTPPPTIHANLHYFAARYWGTESSAGSGTVNPDFSTAFNHLNLDGVVTFTNTALGNELGPEITVIDGGMIETGTLSLDVLKNNSTHLVGGDAFSLGITGQQLLGSGFDSILHIKADAALKVPVWCRHSNGGWAGGFATMNGSSNGGTGAAGFFMNTESADGFGDTDKNTQAVLCRPSSAVQLHRFHNNSSQIESSVELAREIQMVSRLYDSSGNSLQECNLGSKDYSLLLNQNNFWGGNSKHAVQIGHINLGNIIVGYLQQLQINSVADQTSATAEYVGIYLSTTDESSYPIANKSWDGLRTHGGNITTINGWSGAGDYHSGTGGYLTFTGAHMSAINKSESPEIGDILIDQSVIGISHVSESFTQVVRSSTSNQKAAIGVFNGDTKTLNDILNGRGPTILIEDHPYTEEELSNHYALQNTAASEEDSPANTPPTARSKLKDEFANILDTNDIIQINAVGEGAVNVCGENGDFEAGDLIVTSSTPGKGMKQDDDIVRSYTVAKVRENVTFSDPAEVKLIACIYLCG